MREQMAKLMDVCECGHPQAFHGRGDEGDYRRCAGMTDYKDEIARHMQGDESYTLCPCTTYVRKKLAWV